MRHVQGSDGTVLVTRIGKGWLFVPADAWSAFTAAVKHGDYDTLAPLRKGPAMRKLIAALFIAAGLTVPAVAVVTAAAPAGTAAMYHDGSQPWMYHDGSIPLMYHDG